MLSNLYSNVPPDIVGLDVEISDGELLAKSVATNCMATDVATHAEVATNVDDSGNGKQRELLLEGCSHVAWILYSQIVCTGGFQVEPTSCQQQDAEFLSKSKPPEAEFLSKPKPPDAELKVDE